MGVEPFLVTYRIQRLRKTHSYIARFLGHQPTKTVTVCSDSLVTWLMGWAKVVSRTIKRDLEGGVRETGLRRILDAVRWTFTFDWGVNWDELAIKERASEIEVPVDLIEHGPDAFECRCKSGGSL